MYRVLLPATISAIVRSERSPVDFLRYVTALGIFVAVSLVVLICAYAMLRRNSKRKTASSSGIRD